MTDEIIFDEGISWLNRPLLNSLYDVQKLLEGFGQLFLTGYIKGELFSSEHYKVAKAVELASSVVREALAVRASDKMDRRASSANNQDLGDRSLGIGALINNTFEIWNFYE